MGVESQEGYDKYLQNLRSDATQNALKNKQMPTPLLADCVESGIVDVHDETLLFELEKSVGRRLKPAEEPDRNIGNAQNQEKASSTRISSTKGMPVVKTGGDKPPLYAQTVPVPADAIYRQVVADTDARIASDPILQHKALSPSILYNARRDWCTPELFKALVIDPTFIFRLRCAMYPCLVSYYERTFPIDGKTYLVPYITVFNGSKEDGTTVLTKDKFFYDENGNGVYDKYNQGEGFEERTTTFYLNRYGKIGIMKGIIKHMYAPSDFSSPEAISKYLKELEKAYNAKIKSVHAPDAKKQYKQDWKEIEGFLEPYASGREPIGGPKALMSKFMRFHRLMTGGDTGDTFLNIKTGESFYSVTRNDRKECRMDGNGWERVVDVTPCVKNGVIRRDLISYLFERQNPGSVERIKAAGLESLRRLHDKMLSTDRCTKTQSGSYADLDGEDEFYEYFRD